MSPLRDDDQSGHDDPRHGYDLAPEPATISLPGEVVARRTAPEALDALAADLMAQALNCVRAYGEFHLALGGDAAIESFYLRIMSDPELRAFPWDRTHLWQTHERLGAAPDERIAAAVADFLLEHSDIPRSQAHTIDADDPEAASVYESEILAALGARACGQDRLDAVVCTLDATGDAGGLPILGAADSPERGLCVITESVVALSRPFINASRLIAVLAVGADRRDAVARATKPPCSLRPIAGELRWYLDHAAAGVE